jgi:hypothetical protein
VLFQNFPIGAARSAAEKFLGTGAGKFTFPTCGVVGAENPIRRLVGGGEFPVAQEKQQKWKKATKLSRKSMGFLYAQNLCPRFFPQRIQKWKTSQAYKKPMKASKRSKKQANLPKQQRNPAKKQIIQRKLIKTLRKPEK